jgi:hypothetical protein
MGRNNTWSSAGISLFVDVTSILITSPNKNDFQIKITAAFNFIRE